MMSFTEVLYYIKYIVAIFLFIKKQRLLSLHLTLFRKITNYLELLIFQ